VRELTHLCSVTVSSSQTSLRSPLRQRTTISSASIVGNVSIVYLKGRIRELIRINFQFMEDVYRATNDAPKALFARFSAGGSGSLRMHLDVDDIPVCDRALLEQIQTLSSATPGLLTSQPIDSWYVRVTPEYREFELRKAKAGGSGLSDKVRRSRRGFLGSLIPRKPSGPRPRRPPSCAG
jgi:hypothetical protein